MVQELDSIDFLGSLLVRSSATLSKRLIYLCNASFDTAARQTINLVWKSMLIIGLAGRQRDSPVRDAGYEPFDSILCPNRSQKSQEISIRRSSNDVRTLRDQESRRAEFSPTRQHSPLTATTDLRRRLMTCRCQ